MLDTEKRDASFILEFASLLAGKKFLWGEGEEGGEGDVQSRFRPDRRACALREGKKAVTYGPKEIPVLWPQGV